ncbi:MAG: hypothetical protein ACRBM6_09610 [Geminicoccales bacterium]
MTETAGSPAKDWAGDLRAYALAWGLPSLAIIAGSLVDPLIRTAIWSVALIWMGSACLMNARRCGRMHCRYTGPFYLILIVPVLLHGSGLLSLGPYAWWFLGIAILFGGKVIWWATEKAWGTYVDR